MIGKLKGTIVLKDEKGIILEVGDIGYRIRILGEVLGSIKIDEKTSFWIHMAVREDAMDLYGFIEKKELDFFEMLIGISGIGPRTALGILSIAPPETLEKAIASENTSYLTKVSGIGKKNAQKIVLELRGKLSSLEDGDDAGLKEDEDTLLALRSLGYTTVDSREALKKIPDDVRGTSERIKEALKFLSK